MNNIDWPQPIKKQSVDAQIDSMLSTIIERCRKESEQKSLQLPLNDYVERVSYYTAFPKTYIYGLEEKNLDLTKDATESKTFDVVELIAILKALNELYSLPELPKLTQLYEKVKDIINVLNFHNFKKNLFCMSFDYKTTKTGPLLIEDPEYSFNRFHYLNNIQKLRRNHHNILYVDVRLVDKTLVFPRSKLSDTITTAVNSYILFHAVSRRNIYYLFSNKVNKSLYLKWLNEVLLHELKPKSVIIMNDIVLNNKLEDGCITRYHSKNDMLQWLHRRDIPHSANMHKAELFELINKFVIKEIDYENDRLLKAHGHKVLHLPQNCQNLSPTSEFWTQISATLIEKKFDMTDEYDLISAISPIHKLIWPDIENKIIEWENELYDLGIKIEDTIDNLYTFETKNVNANRYSIPEYFHAFI